MPLRKKNATTQASLGEEQQVEARVDHISMHIEGTGSPKEVRQPSNKDLVAATEDLQHSQATIQTEFQSLRQKTSTPQTPQGGQTPQGETKRSTNVPPQTQDLPLNQDQKAPPQPDVPQASPYLTREDVTAILLEAKKAESSAYIDIRPFYDGQEVLPYELHTYLS